ncbi:hypothetical protein HQ585_13955 [candidate division KSB1 bacterium]|nr:hypothetical protein [candidate division KSB1 bacterium]
MSTLKKSGWLILAIVILLIVVGFIPWQSSIKAPCYLTPQKEWSLRQTDPDKIIAKLENNQIGLLENVQLIHIDRSDFIDLTLDKKIVPGKTIQAGEVVAQLASFSDSMTLARLQGDLKEAEQELNVLTVGEKESVLYEAEKALDYAQAELNAYQPIIIRQKELYENNLISIEELQLAETEMELKKINVDIYSARLNNVQSGQKETLQAVSEAEIEQLKNQINLVKAKMDHNQISCPIAGMICHPPAGDFLCLVQKQDTMLVKIAFPGNKMSTLDQNSLITIWINGLGSKLLNAKVIHLGNSLQAVQGTPVFWITAMIESPNEKMQSGMTGVARIKGNKQTFFELVSASWYKFRINR